ncbi:MAG: hypothetical protein JXB36_04570 [Gammaproteobacteria bacterium]|nr:hypothetical protein [Gammaproteobacteria bacterium]
MTGTPPAGRRDDEGVDGGEAGPGSVVVSTETAGLGNRLKSWVSAMRLSPDARVHWPVTPHMPARFGDLFTNDCAVDSIPDGARVWGSWRLVVLPEDERHLPAGFATVGAGANPLIRGAGKLWWTLRGRPDDRYRYMVFPKTHSRRSTRADARHLDLEYGRIPQYFRDLYAPLFRRIDVRPEIARRADRWAAEAGLDAATVGVQVRTWRDDPRRHRKYHRPAAKRLLRLMDGVPRERRFLVVSDEDGVIGSLQQRYGAGRVLHFPRETARADSWRSAEGVSEDLIDMLLLARTRRLFASYLSTFSEAAWWLGGASAEVDVF